MIQKDKDSDKPLDVSAFYLDPESETGNREYKYKLTGLTKEELISAMEKLINDTVLTKSLGTKAREFAIKNHTEEKYVKYFTDLIQKAVLTNK